MEFSVSEEHQTILDTCDKIAQKYNRAYWLKHAKAKTFPQEMWDELADIGMFLLELADNLNVDLLTAIEAKIEKNAEKYPVEKSKGRSAKYTEL